MAQKVKHQLYGRQLANTKLSLRYNLEHHVDKVVKKQNGGGNRLGLYNTGKDVGGKTYGVFRPQEMDKFVRTLRKTLGKLQGDRSAP